MRVIAIDTAGPVVGIGYADAHQQYEWSQRVNKGADALLIAQLQWLQKAYNPNLLVLSIGPGAFTSLRVGVSLALGFAMSKSIGVLPMSSLSGRAAMFPHQRCLSLLDARKGQVYGQLFDSTSTEPIAITESKDVSLVEILPKESFIAVGEGAKVYQDLIQQAGGQVPLDADKSPALQFAKMGFYAEEEAMDPVEVSIQYLRGPSVTPPSNLGTPVGFPSKVIL